MHELGIMMEIVAIAEAKADGRKIKRIAVQVGKLSLVVPDALRFAFELATEGTLLEGAIFEIEEIEGRAQCQTCAAQTRITAIYSCCERCSGTDLKIIQGEELHVKELELI